jgi:hypothetical protein
MRWRAMRTTSCCSISACRKDSLAVLRSSRAGGRRRAGPGHYGPGRRRRSHFRSRRRRRRLHRKPFDMGELLARMRAVIRRKAGSPRRILSNGRLGLDPASREADSEGVSVRLTARAFALLHALLLRPGAILHANGQ